MPFFGAILLVVLAFCGWKYWKHKASERWPWALARFDDGRVQIGESDEGESYAVIVKFTYQVAGATYQGRYWKLLWGYAGKDANTLLRILREGPLYVRYHPTRPKVYVCDPFRDVRP